MKSFENSRHIVELSSLDDIFDEFRVYIRKILLDYFLYFVINLHQLIPVVNFRIAFQVVNKELFILGIKHFSKEFIS